jgi:N6-adenosine-specific RNA methylase IME4
MNARAIARVRSEALPSLEKARQLLTRCRSIGEVQKIKALAQAVASCAASERSRDEALAIVLECRAQRGDILRDLDKTPAQEKGRRSGKNVSGKTPSTFRSEIEANHLDTKTVSDDYKLAELRKSGDLARMIAKGARPNASGALALARLDASLRKSVLGQLGDKADIKAAIGAVKLAAKRELAEEIRANPIVTPDGAYQVIVCDPPWKYDSRAEDTTHRGKNLYPEMTVPEICALPVGRLAQDDCVLWLWTTNAFMRGAYQCLDAWGFQEKTILTWDKVSFGLGDWLRNVTEHCILAVRGRPIVSLTNQTTLLREKRREHSRKPEAFYALVEQLCPGSKLEMFSRSPRKQWTAWGAETSKFKEVAAE